MTTSLYISNCLQVLLSFLDYKDSTTGSNSFLQLPMSVITQERRRLFQLLNGDIFYPISTWPRDIKMLFWKKPIGETDTFKLLLFFLGNGCSPTIISQWILSSQHWAESKKVDKRTRQINYVIKNLTTKGHVWFYYDLHYEEWLFLNGQKRHLNNQ